MYMDLIVLVVFAVLVFVFFKKFSSFIYFFALVEILLRLLTFVKQNLPLPDVASLIDQYIPESIPTMIQGYTTGVVCTVLMWLFAGLMTIFFGYVVKAFWKQKR